MRIAVTSRILRSVYSLPASTTRPVSAVNSNDAMPNKGTRIVDMTNPKDHRQWAAFEEFADCNGIELEYREDWQAWWDCFLAGVNAQLKDPDTDPKE